MTANKDDLDFQEDGAEFENDMTSTAAPAKKGGSRGLLALLVVLLAGGGAGGYYYMTQMSGGMAPEAGIPADVPQTDMAAAGGMPVDPAQMDPNMADPNMVATPPVDPATGMAPTDPSMIAVDPATGMPIQNAMPAVTDPAQMDPNMADPNMAGGMPPADPAMGAVIDPATGLAVTTSAPIDPSQMNPDMPADATAVTPEDAGMMQQPTAPAQMDPNMGGVMPVTPDMAGQGEMAQMPAEQMPTDQVPTEQLPVDPSATAQPMPEAAMAVPVAVADTAALDALRAENDTLRQEVGNLTSRLSSLEGELSSLRSEVGNTAPVAAASNDDEVAELKRSLEKLQREVKKLAEKSAAPVVPTRSYVPSRTSNVDTAVGSAGSAPAPVVSPTMPQPGVSSWTLRSAQPGSAILASGSGELRTVKVGDVVPGLGRITAIAIGTEGKWVVRGTLAAVNQ